MFYSTQGGWGEEQGEEEEEGALDTRREGGGPPLLNPSPPATAPVSRAPHPHPGPETAGRRRQCPAPPCDSTSNFPRLLPRLFKELLKGRTEKIKGPISRAAFRKSVLEGSSLARPGCPHRIDEWQYHLGPDSGTAGGGRAWGQDPGVR